MGHHGIDASLTVEPNAPSPAFSLSYGYGRLPVDFTTRIFRSVSPRGGYRLNGKDVPEAMIVPCPVYLAVAPGLMVMLPSMKIVPFTVSNFVAAFQESSPRVVEPAMDLHV